MKAKQYTLIYKIVSRKDSTTFVLLNGKEKEISTTSHEYCSTKVSDILSLNIYYEWTRDYTR